MNLSSAIRLSCSALAIVAVAGAASARPPQYTWRIPGVPDFDQERLPIFDVPGLPGGGSMYCYPTSATNWMNYIAGRGYPNLQPGAGWHGNASGPVYNEVTNVIADMGALMNTSATGGTGVTGILEGTQAALDAAYPGDFDVLFWSCSRGVCPDYSTITNNMRDGRIVVLGIGWYSADDEIPGNFNRGGGHAVCLTGADDYFLPSRTWRYTDPGFDSDNPDQPFNQSPYVTHDTPVQMQTWLFNNNITATLPRLMDYTSAFIDGYAVITAKFGWAPRPDLTGIDQLSAPITPTHSNPVRPVVTSFDSPDGTAIDDVLLYPQLDRVFVQTRGNPATGAPGGVNCLMADGSVRFVRSGAGVQGMIFSRNLELFVLEANSLVRYRENASGGWSEMSRRSFAQGFDAIAYDDNTDEVLCFSGARGTMTRFDQDLANAPIVENLPSSLPSTTKIRVFVCPSDSTYTLIDVQTGFLYHCQIDAAAGGRSREHILLARQFFPELQETAGGGGGAGKVSYQDLGFFDRVLVPAGGIIREYTRTATGFERTTNSRFAGLPSGPSLTLSESRTNFDPALHSGPGWENVLPTEFGRIVSDCPYDLNQNAHVDFADLTLALANFGSAQLIGDLGDADLDGDCDFADITAVLRHFGEICD